VNFYFTCFKPELFKSSYPPLDSLFSKQDLLCFEINEKYKKITGMKLEEKISNATNEYLQVLSTGEDISSEKIYCPFGVVSLIIFLAKAVGSEKEFLEIFRPNIFSIIKSFNIFFFDKKKKENQK